jgi:hypothetical protein
MLKFRDSLCNCCKLRQRIAYVRYIWIGFDIKFLWDVSVLDWGTHFFAISIEFDINGNETRNTR